MSRDLFPYEDPDSPIVDKSGPPPANHAATDVDHGQVANFANEDFDDDLDAIASDHEPLDMKAFMQEAIDLARLIQNTHQVNDRYMPERRLREYADEFLGRFASYPKRFS